MRETGKAIDENMLKRLADGLGTKSHLQKDPVHRLIWEYCVILDTELKTKAARPMAGQIRTSFGILGGQTSLEPMTEITYLYPDNPCLQREYDKFANEVLAAVAT